MVDGGNCGERDAQRRGEDQRGQRQLERGRQALADVERTASTLAATTGLPVRTGYLSAAAPTVAEAVAAARATGVRPVAVASYLLAPGFFADRLGQVGADLVTAPLLPHPALADLVLRRYDEAAAG